MDARTDNPSRAQSPTTTITDLPLKPGRWVLDKGHARVGFAVRQLGLTKVRGHFRDLEAELVVGPSPEDTAVTASVALASIDTALAVRDANVRGRELLDVERRPTVTFRSTGIHGSGEDWTLDGDLTVGDVTAPVSLAVQLAGVAEAFDGSRHAGFEARGELHRRDFGLSLGPLDPAIGQVVELQLDLEFVEPA